MTDARTSARRPSTDELWRVLGGLEESTKTLAASSQIRDAQVAMIAASQARVEEMFKQQMTLLNGHCTKCGDADDALSVRLDVMEKVQETDRVARRLIMGVAIGAPPLIASLIEIAKGLRGH